MRLLHAQGVHQTILFTLRATISASAAAVDGPDEAYKYEEYSADSETVPDILSTYKTHIVFLTVKDPCGV